MNTHSPQPSDTPPRHSEKHPPLPSTAGQRSNDGKRTLRRHLEVNARLEELADV